LRKQKRRPKACFTKLFFCFPFLLFRTFGQTPEQVDFFETRVRPILAAQCYTCHTNSRLGGLRVDSKEALLSGGNSGPAITPGKPDESLLIRAVRQTDERLKMPLGGKLKPAEIEALTTWVKLGAPWSASTQANGTAAGAKEWSIRPDQRAFWAFQPISRPAATSSVDSFILARLQQEGLKQVQAADKHTLIRRAYLDLAGLPPTPQEVSAFEQDSSPRAFAQLVDRLLASPQYGERWGRYWLDVARYGEADVRGNTSIGYETYSSAFRYRDWVIQAMNADMPYDRFVKLQLAADLMPGQQDNIAALGFLGLGPWYWDLTEPQIVRADERHERVDVVTRGLLGITVACARCHDHKFDPISQQDYYGIAGVFSNVRYHEYPLAAEPVVKAYTDQAIKVENQEKAISEYLNAQARKVADALAGETAKYAAAAYRVLGTVHEKADQVASAEHLDAAVLARWAEFLGKPHPDYLYVKDWEELLAKGGSPDRVKQVAAGLQETILRVNAQKKKVDEENDKRLSAIAKPKAGEKIHPDGFESYEDFCPGCGIELIPTPRAEYTFWEDLFHEQDGMDPNKKDPGVLLFKEKELERFLDAESKGRLETLRAALDGLKKELPPPYPFVHGVADVPNPHDLKIALRGNPNNLGPETPRRFPEILSTGTPQRFTRGSGRLELADAIVSNPLFARVIVNRVWKAHFGRGIVDTASNFGAAGDRPSHPELLEYLAGRFIDSGMSLKQLHRDIMLSAAYQLSTDYSAADYNKDGENRFYWRYNRRRLDAEALRDSILAVAGSLDPAVGGPSLDWNDDNHRRSVYGKVSRFKVDTYLSLFDFPDPSTTSEQRVTTMVPLQRLFFMNSSFVYKQASKLSETVAGEKDDGARIRETYRRVFGRQPSEQEMRLGLEFLDSGRTDSERQELWREYARALFSSNEFTFLN
jgi:hypothetical protein